MSVPTRVVVALGRVMVLSAVGSVTVRVVSKPSSVVPSKIMLLPAPRVTDEVKDGDEARM